MKIEIQVSADPPLTDRQYIHIAHLIDASVAAVLPDHESAQMGRKIMSAFVNLPQSKRLRIIKYLMHSSKNRQQVLDMVQKNEYA